jgi:hypothetical protein
VITSSACTNRIFSLTYLDPREEGERVSLQKEKEKEKA